MRIQIEPDWTNDTTMKRIRHTGRESMRKHKTIEQLIAQSKTVAGVCRVID